MPTFSLVHLEFLLTAAQWTIGLSIAAFVGGGLVGFVVALARISDLRVLRIAATVYIQLVQGTPLLILLFAIYFGIALLGYTNLPPLIAASAGLIIYSSGFLAEICDVMEDASIKRTYWLVTAG